MRGRYWPQDRIKLLVKSAENPTSERWSKGKKTAGSYSIKIFKNNYNVHVMRGNVCQLEWVIKIHLSTIYFLILRLQNALKLLFLSKENSDFTKSATISGINLQATPTTPTVSVILAAERAIYAQNVWGSSQQPSRPTVISISIKTVNKWIKIIIMWWVKLSQHTLIIGSIFCLIKYSKTWRVCHVQKL